LWGNTLPHKEKERQRKEEKEVGKLHIMVRHTEKCLKVRPSPWALAKAFSSC
jgi:hypothetical protein